MSHPLPPVIGIICSEFQTDEGQAPPRFGQSQTYIQAVLQAGAVPLLIPEVADPARLRRLYERLDGLLLPGGGDVDPVHYGEVRHERCGRVTPIRDETELALVRWAAAEGKPLLGICRGIQVLNVALGGSLYQDIEAQLPGAGKHDWYPGYPRDHLPHPVAVTPGSRLARILDTTSLPVNSLHHQAIKKVAAGLTVVARAPDGIIEGVEGTGHPFLIGVQWHPEELAGQDVRARRLFDALAEACRA